MNKELLRQHIIDLQKAIVSLSQEVRAQERTFQEEQEALLLDILLVLDSFENVLDMLGQRAQPHEKAMWKAVRSFAAIQRKMLRVLEEHGVEKIEFPDGHARIGFCTIVRTESRDNVEEGTILTIIRNGYRKGDRVLRPAEVVTVGSARSGGAQVPAANPS